MNPGIRILPKVDELSESQLHSLSEFSAAYRQAIALRDRLDRIETELASLAQSKSASSRKSSSRLPTSFKSSPLEMLAPSLPWTKEFNRASVVRMFCAGFFCFFVTILGAAIHGVPVLAVAPLPLILLKLGFLYLFVRERQTAQKYILLFMAGHRIAVSLSSLKLILSPEYGHLYFSKNYTGGEIVADLIATNLLWSMGQAMPVLPNLAMIGFEWVTLLHHVAGNGIISTPMFMRFALSRGFSTLVQVGASYVFESKAKLRANKSMGEKAVF